MSDVTKTDIKASNLIVLRSVYGKVGMKYSIQPCPNKNGRMPDCVKHVNSNGDMILTDAERNSGKHFVKESDTIIIEDGKTFNLDDDIDAAEWEAIKNCPLIAPSRYAEDGSGNSLIDGDRKWNSRNPRNGIAELYVEHPGEDVVRKVSKKREQHKAVSFILDDDRGSEGRLLKARVLGKNMTNMPDADVEDYLISIAEKDPKKIINLYTGGDISLRILFIEAKDKKVIKYKNKLYIYGDDHYLGATDDAVISWMKDPKNKAVMQLIKKETYPEMYDSTDTSKKSKSKDEN